jgi:signal peptidase I
VSAQDRMAGNGDENDQSGERRRPGLLRQAVEFVFMLGLAWVLALGVRTYVVEPYIVPTGSMIPTVIPGDTILGSKILLRFRAPAQGDIVMVADPEGKLPNLMKRVVAVGGQTVDIRDGKLLIDGVPQSEPYVQGAVTEPGPYPLPVAIPAGYVWLMGDNRGNSKDARWFGPQPASSVRAIAFFRYWPANRMGTP